MLSYTAQMCGPLHRVLSNLDTRHEDEGLKTIEVDCSKHISVESGFPDELPRSSIKWVSLYKEKSDSDARSEDDEVKSLVSEPSLEEENGFDMDSECSDITHCWKEGTHPSDVTARWEEESSTSGITHSEVGSLGVIPSWNKKKLISKTQSDKEAIEDEADAHCMPEQLFFHRGISNSKEDTDDTIVSRGMDNSLLGDEHPCAQVLASEKDKDVSINASDLQSVIYQLRKELEELKAVSIDQHKKSTALGKNLADSGLLIQQLRYRVKLLESCSQDSSRASVEVLNDSCGDKLSAESFDESLLGVDELIYVMGGYDGVSWLPTMDCYSPSRDIVRSLKPMRSVRSNASAAVLNGLVYIFGGWNGYGNLWYDTVECYNPLSKEWISCPSLSKKKGCLAGASINNKIFAVGGGNGKDCFREAEMFDPVLGRWIPTQSMLQKRFASAASQLNGVLYVVGGYDGKDYLKSAERFDPREASWSKLQGMNTSRASHAMTVFNGKLYVLGGYDGNKYLPSVEIFDPCMGTWMADDDMNQSRAHFAAPVIGDTIYAVGGQTESNNMINLVETYKLGQGWSVTKLKGIGTRCLFSAVLH